MQMHEEALHVAVHATLPHLIRVDLDEGVVPALGLDAQLERAEWTGEGARPGRRSRDREAHVGKEGVRGAEHVRRIGMTAIEVAHDQGIPFRAWSTSCIHSVFSSGLSESLWNWMPTAHCPVSPKLCF